MFFCMIMIQDGFLIAIFLECLKLELSLIQNHDFKSMVFLFFKPLTIVGVFRYYLVIVLATRHIGRDGGIGRRARLKLVW